MTPRRVLWLIEQLPETSAYTASVKGGPEHRGWTMQNTLLAGVFNGIAGGNYQRGGGKGKKPKFIEPPRIKRAAQRGRSKAAAHIQRGLAIAKQAITSGEPDGSSSE